MEPLLRSRSSPVSGFLFNLDAWPEWGICVVLFCVVLSCLVPCSIYVIIVLCLIFNTKKQKTKKKKYIGLISRCLIIYLLFVCCLFLLTVQGTVRLLGWNRQRGANDLWEWGPSDHPTGRWWGMVGGGEPVRTAGPGPRGIRWGKNEWGPGPSPGPCLHNTFHWWLLSCQC